MATLTNSICSGGVSSIVEITSGAEAYISAPGNIFIDSMGNTVLIGAQYGNVTLGKSSVPVNFLAGINTNPLSSPNATSSFATSLTAGVDVTNSNDFNLLCNICIMVTSAVSATILIGVSPSGGSADTIVPTFSTATPIIITLSAYVPGNYLLLVDTTGTISISSITVQSFGV